MFLNPWQTPFGRAEFSASEVAYTRSRDALSVTPHGGREVTQLAGRRITVYRKQPDGRWLLARDTHPLSPVERP